MPEKDAARSGKTQLSSQRINQRRGVSGNVPASRQG
jgi:hypothetical protein